MATVGISVVRGVVLAAGPPEIVLRSVQRRLGGARSALRSAAYWTVLLTSWVTIPGHRVPVGGRAVHDRIGAGGREVGVFVAGLGSVGAGCAGQGERGFDEFGTVLVIRVRWANHWMSKERWLRGG